MGGFWVCLHGFGVMRKMTSKMVKKKSWKWWLYEGEKGQDRGEWMKAIYHGNQPSRAEGKRSSPKWFGLWMALSDMVLGWRDIGEVWSR